MFGPTLSICTQPLIFYARPRVMVPPLGLVLSALSAW